MVVIDSRSPFSAKTPAITQADRHGPTIYLRKKPLEQLSSPELAVTAPFVAPLRLLFDTGFDMPAAIFPCYPYARSEAGFMLIGRRYGDSVEQDAPYGTAECLKPWSLRISVENGSSFAGLNRLTGTVFLDTCSRFGFLANFSYFQENLAGGRVDDTLFNDYNFTYRIAQNDYLQMCGTRPTTAD